MIDNNIDEGIHRLIRYIRRMNLLKEEQLRLLLEFQKNSEVYEGIDVEGHISWIRQMSLLTDDQIRTILINAKEDVLIRKIFEDSAKKKALLDMQKLAKDVKSNPKFFARKVDNFS